MNHLSVGLNKFVLSNWVHHDFSMRWTVELNKTQQRNVAEENKRVERNFTTDWANNISLMSSVRYPTQILIIFRDKKFSTPCKKSIRIHQSIFKVQLYFKTRTGSEGYHHDYNYQKTPRSLLIPCGSRNLLLHAGRGICSHSFWNQRWAQDCRGSVLRWHFCFKFSIRVSWTWAHCLFQYCFAGKPASQSAKSLKASLQQFRKTLTERKRARQTDWLTERQTERQTDWLRKTIDFIGWWLEMNYFLLFFCHYYTITNNNHPSSMLFFDIIYRIENDNSCIGRLKIGMSPRSLTCIRCFIRKQTVTQTFQNGTLQVLPLS